MLTMMSSWKGPVEVDGKRYDSIHDLKSNMFTDNEFHIRLLTSTTDFLQKFHAEYGTNDTPERKVKEYRITVKQYMTQKSSPAFDFMAKWNNDNPMPMRTMVGHIIKQTPGMVQMELRGKASDAEVYCMRCGRKLTNPISKRYGIGPECLTKLGFICGPEDVDTINNNIEEITWTGWIIKSAITEQEEI